MIRSFNATAYATARARLGRNLEEYSGLFRDVTACLLRTHLGIIQGPYLAVFMFIAGRTLFYNKAAQAIHVTQFLNGVHTGAGLRIASGVGLSESTLRKHLKSLASDGYIRVTRLEDNSEGAPSLYEIDCKTVLGFEIYDEETFMPLPEIRQKRQKMYEELGQKMPLDDLDTPTEVEETPLVEVTSVDRLSKELKSLKDPSTEKPVSGGQLSARELVSSVLARTAATRTSRIASGVAKDPTKLTTAEVQAMVDSAMSTYYPDLPRQYVAGKAFGAMRNHLKRSAPADFRDFLESTIRNWATTTLQNAKASARRRETTKPLPRHFDFAAFAYHLPYFLKVYTNNRGPQRVADVTAESERIKRAETALKAAQEEVVSLRRVVATRQATPGHMTAPSRPATRRAAAAPSLTPAARRKPTDAEIDAGFEAMKRGV